MKTLKKLKNDKLSVLLGVYLIFPVLSYFKDRNFSSNLTDFIEIGSMLFFLFLAITSLGSLILALTKKIKPNFSLKRLILTASVLFVPYYFPACCAVSPSYKNWYGLTYEQGSYFRDGSKNSLKFEGVFVVPVVSFALVGFILTSDYLNYKSTRKR